MRSEEFRALIGAHFKTATWFAQFEPHQRWHRADWQRKIIRQIPTWLRNVRRSVKSQPSESVSAEPAWQKSDCRHPFSCDDFYPLPWQLAMESMYQPPPPIIIAAVQP
jgi:hypothetical protein